MGAFSVQLRQSSARLDRSIHSDCGSAEQSGVRGSKPEVGNPPCSSWSKDADEDSRSITIIPLLLVMVPLGILLWILILGWFLPVLSSVVSAGIGALQSLIGRHGS